MVALVALFGLAAFVLASLIVGTRILLLARRTRGMPETVMGASLVLAGGIGTALAIAPRLLPGMTPDTVYWLQQVASTSSQIGFAMVCFFVWRVFRPGETWAMALAGLCAAALMVGLGGELMVRRVGESTLGPEASGGAWVWLSIATRLVIYAWSGVESFRYWSVMRRRRAIGLAQSSLVDRFFYWGVCNAAVVVMFVSIGCQRVISEGAAVMSWISLGVAALGFVVAWSLWRAFFPGRSGRTNEADLGGAAAAA